MNKGPSVTPIFAHFNCQGCYVFWLAHKPSSGTAYKSICKKALTYNTITD
jgi:hypothetical protein